MSGPPATALGMDTLELARVHERALVSLDYSADQHKPIECSELIVNKTITVILETHRALRQDRRDLNRLSKKLRRP